MQSQRRNRTTNSTSNNTLNLPPKSRFLRRFKVLFEVLFVVLEIVTQIVPKQSCDKTGLTAGVWDVWLVGKVAKHLVSIVILCIFITPLFLALFTNGLLADPTSHTRGSARPFPLLCTQFSSELLSLAHPTVSPRFQAKIHPHVGTLLHLGLHSTFVLHSYFCLLLLMMIPFD
jgi:hypothetical protein